MMKEKYGSLQVDIDRIQLEQKENDKTNKNVKDHKWFDGIIGLLNNKGFTDAAQFLMDKRDKEMEQ